MKDAKIMGPASLLHSIAARLPDKIALVFAAGAAEETITYRDLDAEADRVASGLVRMGVVPGDRVAIAMHNVPHFPFAYFGALRAGAVAVPLNVMLTEPEVAAILRDSGAGVVLGAPPFSDVVGRATKREGGQRVVTVEEWDELGPRGAGFEGREVEVDALAVLAYTAGTTGEPKGAMLSHANLVANLRQQMALPEAVRESDVLLMALPLFHIFGLNVTLGLMVMTGATGVLVERFEPVPTLRLIERQKVTVLFGAPPMYQAWANTPGVEQYDLSSVRLAVSGAAALPRSELASFKTLFGVDVYEGYGLTETAPTLTSNRASEAPVPGSVGKPLADVDLRIVDDGFADVELGDPGEIVVRGPNVFRGYWNRDTETEAAFRDGWFRTGDVAVQDEDGHIYLVDRMRDLIIVSGFNVYPSEVEEALGRDPRVREAGVIGVEHEYTGEAVKAFVVLDPGAQVSEEELQADLATRLARFKCPSSIEFVDELPHALSGKVARRALRHDR